MKELIQKLTDGNDLNAKEAEQAMRTIMGGKASETEMAAFLIALKMKGESPVEIASLARVMREFSEKIKPRVRGTLVDVCGTGGDKTKTFNISTTSMFVVAGAGIPVAKHGNRAITSHCGSADVLEALGVNLNLPFGKIKRSIEKVGIGFMFAPMHHSAMKHVMPVRRQLGVRTVFNILGPLTNPANAKAQLMGVFDPSLTEKIANVFKLLGLKHVMVVHGQPGLDELSTMGRTKITELKNKKVRTYYIKPEQFGLKRAKQSDLRGGTLKENASILKGILNGEISGRKKDIVLLNAAAGIVVGGKAKTLREGFELAEETLDSGLACKKLEDFVGFANVSG